jgi:hypothetical protein
MNIVTFINVVQQSEADGLLFHCHSFSIRRSIAGRLE